MCLYLCKIEPRQAGLRVKIEVLAISMIHEIDSSYEVQSHEYFEK